MKRHFIATLSLVAAATLGLATAPAFTAEKPAATPAAPGAAAATPDAATKPYPYTGKVTKLDPTGKSIILNGAKDKERVILVDAGTKITKDGKPATLADLTVGEEVRGQVLKAGEVVTAKSVLIGAKAKPAATPAAADAKPGAAPAAPAATPAAKPKKP